MATVQNDRIAQVTEHGEMTDAWVPRLSDELDTLRFEFGSRLGDIRDAYSESRVICDQR